MKNRIIIRFFVLIVTMLLLPFFNGCQKGTGVQTEYVEGTVRLNGTPIATAQITFIPKDEQVGMRASGFTDQKGVYKLTSSKGDAGKGTFAGEYIVTVHKVDWIMERRMVDGEEQDVPVKEISLVPAIYMLQNTTPLTATVIAGKNTRDFDLEGVPSLPNARSSAK